MVLYAELLIPENNKMDMHRNLAYTFERMPG